MAVMGSLSMFICKSFILRKQAVIALEIIGSTGNISFLRGYEFEIEAVSYYQKQSLCEYFLNS